VKYVCIYYLPDCSAVGDWEWACPRRWPNVWAPVGRWCEGGKYYSGASHFPTDGLTLFRKACSGISFHRLALRTTCRCPPSGDVPFWYLKVGIYPAYKGILVLNKFRLKLLLDIRIDLIKFRINFVYCIVYSYVYINYPVNIKLTMMFFLSVVWTNWYVGVTNPYKCK